MTRRAPVALLAVAVLAATVAWRLQASAAQTLAQARAAGARTVPDAGGGPPDVADYERILATLEASVAVRREIDDRLGEVERVVGALRGRQRAAAGAAEATSSDLARIARALGGARTSARASVGGLRRLGRSLTETVRLAWLIARELEELDRSLGP